MNSKEQSRGTTLIFAYTIAKLRLLLVISHFIKILIASSKRKTIRMNTESSCK